ncbi:hypothetical protein [Methylobacterium fujisawaense]|uniref:hypothetical protein n=1 Tax=Methylobacterium fujisawaense TaxID=107400 RepID=UPI00313D5DBB
MLRKLTLVAALGCALATSACTTSGPGGLTAAAVTADAAKAVALARRACGAAPAIELVLGLLDPGAFASDEALAAAICRSPILAQ